jgi:hypothetical protein
MTKIDTSKLTKVTATYFVRDTDVEEFTDAIDRLLLHIPVENVGGYDLDAVTAEDIGGHEEVLEDMFADDEYMEEN